MSRKVIAIGLDSADPDLIQNWIEQGQLPHLASLQNEGAHAVLENKANIANSTMPFGGTEGSWVSFQTGVRPDKTGYWETFDYDPEKYTATSDQHHGGYDYQEYPPFYALGDKYRVATFDLPVSAVVPNVNGLQVVGWGGHWPFVDRGSDPQDLLKILTGQYGKNTILYKDYGEFWDGRYLKWLESNSILSIERRTEITIDLMNREPWDMFLATYGESHGAAHDLWFTSVKDHPLHHLWDEGRDPLLKVFQKIDDAIGRIRAHVPKDACFICYSVHGIESNVTDLGSFFFLPELMYRFQFPGEFGFAKGTPDEAPVPPISKGKHNHWFGEIWRQRHFKNRFIKQIQPYLPAMLIPRGNWSDFLYPYFLDFFGPETGWLPAVWYKPAWPRMRSYAIPSFSDGHIRINVEGRESKGLVSEQEYETECNRVTDFLRKTINPRNGEPIVRDIIRTRTSPFEEGKLPDADLIVIWDNQPFDVVDSPDVGRIGPVPYHRTGGHRNKGFMMASGPGIPAGTKLPTAEAIDLAPTFLSLMGAECPDYFDGHSLLGA